MAKNCQFVQTTVAENISNYLVDALINGIDSCQIRQRLLEKDEDLTFDAAYALARSLDSAAIYARDYSSTVTSAAIQSDSEKLSPEIPLRAAASSSSHLPKCHTCVRPRHPKGQCPARFSSCHRCNLKGHYAGSSACELTKTKRTAAMFSDLSLASLTGTECISAASNTDPSSTNAQVVIQFRIVMGYWSI